MNILLDYFFSITAITPTPQASTAFLKQACVVVKPKAGQEGNVGNIYPCTSMVDVAARTDNAESQQLFDAGMNRVYLLLANDLDLADALAGHGSDFFTLLISSDFDDDDIDSTQASGTITIDDYADLVSGTADKVTIAGVDLTAQAGAAILGQAVFQAATSNNATATSLAAQINAHATLKNLVVATVENAVVTVKAKDAGSGGNDIAVAYHDNDTNVGITLGGLSGGKLAGGDGFFLGTFKGVIGISSDDTEFLAEQANKENRCAFYTSGSNGAKNMFFAFGKLLSNALAWRNQQFIEMPFEDDIDELGEANALFDDNKISFVISDSEYGNRLALFAQGGKAIVAPYIRKNLQIDIQSRALSYVSANQPDYTRRDGALLEDELQKVIDDYVDRRWISGGNVEIKLEQENFIASGYFVVPEAKALWRLVGEIRQA